MRGLTSALASCALALLLTPHAVAEHTETLYVRPILHANKALAHFHFATSETPSQESLYPAVLRQILTKYAAASVHLSFAVGHYTEGLYGTVRTANGGSIHAPFGTRLQVEFQGDEAAASGTISERWKGVTSELGGVFSASLNQMHETIIHRISPDISPWEVGAYDSNSSMAAASQFLQATLAREELCTENLTPWLKMLPCRSHAGLGVLVDPIKILSGEYAMLSIYAARNASSGHWRFEQHLVTVQPTDTADAWSLRSLLLDDASSSKVSELSACPLASQSSLTTQGDFPTTTSLTNGVSTTQRLLSVSAAGSARRPQDVVAIHRFQTGFGQVHGGLAVRLENRHAACTMAVTYHDLVPWYLRLYLHTFQSRIVSLTDSAPPTGSAAALDFEPAELRGRPTQLRVRAVLPPQSALVLSVQFDKAFVRLSEHPPDANRGFDIASGVATFSPLAACGKTSAEPRRVVYSEPLLVALPTPDFSMPYNVITLTSTVVAFFAGSMLNTLLRKAPRIKRILAQDGATTK